MRNTHDQKEPSHSHLFKVEVELISAQLDELGCVIDFEEFDRMMADVLGPLRGQDLFSTEIIAQVLFEQVEKMLEDRSVDVTAVTVWEDERHAGCFRRNL